MIISAALSARFAAKLLYSSPRSLCASFQSSTAVPFEMASAQPAVRERKGALTMIAVSATMATGVVARLLDEPVSSLMDARGLVMPSWLALVGTLTKGAPMRKAASFATSMTLPPPTPSTTAGRCWRASTSTAATWSSVALATCRSAAP